MKNILGIIIIFLGFIAQGQIKPENIKTKIFTKLTDTIQIDAISINPSYFKVYDRKNQELDSVFYKVDFARSEIILLRNIKDYLTEIKVEYLPLPDFLTKTYTAFDKKLIVPRVTDDAILFSFQQNKKNKYYKPFDGLYTNGSLSRAVTIGNNQDAVVNSIFNLQIEGKLSEQVGIRASITDNEVPLQEGGYTQRLDEFDKVFVELFSKDWSIKAGDIDLVDTDSYFTKFQKKISGISVRAKLRQDNAQTDFFGSGAMVRGKFSSYKFNGVDGNQGPYKILGPLNEQFVIMISGSERVFANGKLLTRGENFDYTIDYNTGEITFTTIYQVNSNLRFIVEFQIANNNYTRFLTFDSAEFNSDKLKVGVKFYSETDSKNKPLQQELTETQKIILTNAGDDRSKMVAPSEIKESYSENKILYKKISQNNIEIFEYSIDPSDELYRVSFSYVGENNGDYFIQTTLAAGRVYKYIPESNNVKQGSYEPVILLTAPEKKQIITVNGNYQPGKRTNINSEIAISNNDKNLFSDIDNDDNNGLATKIDWQQKIIDKNWHLDSKVNFEYIDKNFQTIERYRSIEFSRDWNINALTVVDSTEQQFISGNLSYKNDSIGAINYQFESLTYGEIYKGDRHSFLGNLKFNNTNIFADGSIMKNKDLLEENRFYRLYSTIVHQFSKKWIGAKFNYENNQRKEIITEKLTELSHRYSEVEGFFGLGDSTKVFAEIGYNYRTSDSLRIFDLENVYSTNTYFLKSKLIQKKTTDLALVVNYSKIQNESPEDENVLNSRITYRQKMFHDFLTLQTLYETQSGNLAQQEFAYIEVQPGKGFYMWIDFNENGIQELDEFVVAQFQDQAKYVRVLLPTINFIKTNQNKFSQSINLSAIQWQNENGWKKRLSHFSDQAYFLMDSKSKRDDSGFNLNPFKIQEDDLLALDLVIKNSLFFNRGLQKLSSVYSFINTRKKSLFIFGDQDIKVRSHQFQFLHKVGNFWLMDIIGGFGKSSSKSFSYTNRNYILQNINIQPKMSFLYSKNNRLDIFYKFKKKENQLEDFETLKMHVLGADFQFANKEKFSLKANINLIFNKFDGNSISPVAFQMLEGLQPGTNLTWLLNLQKRLTSFLDLNVNYFGRKSESSKTIHTGSVQLRASF